MRHLLLPSNPEHQITHISGTDQSKFSNSLYYPLSYSPPALLHREEDLACDIRTISNHHKG
ncbi:hypothetical protein Krac_9596 [Ktedonobacter racemifer DSM 44963]|uniref:Uncharacterized protein n=1 Tax=Ktedonobacter racemifer DSM 44963 TaxID=485913 RepID=D6TCS3_KTERA|nr:hypothetical protein Krac_9596 [Ktedonobacter racemifer DSM 44963]